jgi:uncharacterized repeat protein (TIGR04138 family)
MPSCALDFTQRRIHRDRRPAGLHVTVPQLVEGCRDHALAQFGPMALTVLDEWGVRSCEDLGNVLFNLVEANQFSLTEEDRREQFASGFDFQEAFRKPFLPSGRATDKPASAPKQ